MIKRIIYEAVMEYDINNQSLQQFIDKLPGSFIIELYQDTEGKNLVEDYISQVALENSKLCGKILFSIAIVKLQGYKAREPYSKSLKDGIFEIRAIEGNNISRVLYFFVDGNKLILTNAFTKKTQSTPQEELQKAIKLKQDYFKRNAKKD